MQVAIVTAASKGMGRACAEVLHQKGYELALMSRSSEVNEVAAKLRAVSIQGDVTSKSDLKKLVDLTMDTYGRVDAVVNNTGHPAKGKLLELTEDEWRQGLDMVLLNVAKMAQLTFPL